MPRASRDRRQVDLPSSDTKKPAMRAHPYRTAPTRQPLPGVRACAGGRAAGRGQRTPARAGRHFLLAVLS